MKSGFYDELSEKTYNEIPRIPASNRVMLHVSPFSVGQSYVTAKVENRRGDTVNINIEGGRLGVDLQETLFRLGDNRLPKHAYIVTTINETGRILARKVPVLGVKDWLLIYEDDLFLLAVKDAYDEIEIMVV
ncbi:hypothetical protein [Nitrososphaera viennensis]|uniref:Uncharacterized protein n=2 Tax=Nitrososphaera viennensis TaxID=1034015 RepID=A0A060HEX2_9ARCH|nr:hypothetical protein [Nitrososphaera viennensis]AIC14183.1 hypothetical protein NVIE_000020 [Nitrososphaera viennensis EN76]UVS69188.1 hypothetical protein NWT39_00010 [Nitrososphaera viennensis]